MSTGALKFVSGYLFRPRPEDAHDLPDPGADALGRTPPVLSQMRAVARAVRSPVPAFLPDRPVVQIPEFLHGNGERGGALHDVIEKEIAQMPPLKHRLISQKLHTGIGQERIPVRPAGAARRAVLETMVLRALHYFLCSLKSNGRAVTLQELRSLLLRLMTRKVPVIGSFQTKSSNHWNFSDRKFQSLEVLRKGGISAGRGLPQGPNTAAYSRRSGGCIRADILLQAQFAE